MSCYRRIPNPIGQNSSSRFVEVSRYEIPQSSSGWVTRSLDVCPPNSVALIVMYNNSDSSVNNCGVRAVGSSDNLRFLQLPKAYPSGWHSNIVSPVQLDSNKQAQFYQYSTEARYYCVGYFKDVSFDESFTEFVPDGAVDGTWNTASQWNSTPYSIPSGRVAAFAMGSKRQSYNNKIGLRKGYGGAGQDRYLDIGQTYNADCYNGFLMFVHPETTTGYDIYAEQSSNALIYYLGSFSNEISFIEDWYPFTVKNSNYAVDISSRLDKNNRATHSIIYTEDQRSLELRQTGSGLDRLFSVATRSSQPYWGFGMISNTDNSGRFDAYTDVTSDAYGYFTGYFK